MEKLPFGESLRFHGYLDYVLLCYFTRFFRLSWKFNLQSVLKEAQFYFFDLSPLLFNLVYRLFFSISSMTLPSLSWQVCHQNSLDVSGLHSWLSFCIILWVLSPKSHCWVRIIVTLGAKPRFERWEEKLVDHYLSMKLLCYSIKKKY